MDQYWTSIETYSPLSYRVEIKEEEGIFTSTELKHNKKTQKVYWIYKETRDEEAYFDSGQKKHSDRCGKIFVMLGESNED